MHIRSNDANNDRVISSDARNNKRRPPIETYKSRSARVREKVQTIPHQRTPTQARLGPREGRNWRPNRRRAPMFDADRPTRLGFSPFDSGRCGQGEQAPLRMRVPVPPVEEGEEIATRGCLEARDFRERAREADAEGWCCHLACGRCAAPTASLDFGAPQ